ncbi:MAG: hypothetical protein LBT86_03200 [Deltaproteobacteria bacterium]|nr:hypothetical protein [Deltaproteobacteria bacterium]
MASESHQPPPIDDWDSLTLDPDVDDWDETPPTPVDGQKGGGANSKPMELTEPPKTAEDTFDIVSDEPPDWLDTPNKVPAPQPPRPQVVDDFDDQDEFLDLSPLEAQDGSPDPQLGNAPGGAILPRSSQVEDSLDTPAFPDALKSIPQATSPDDSLDTPTFPDVSDQETKTVMASLGDSLADSTPSASPKEAKVDSHDHLSEFDEVLAPSSAKPEPGQEASDPPKPPQDQDAAARLKDKDGLADGESPPLTEDSSRNDFLKSLIDFDEEDAPKKVELDLDGIYNEAKKEADNLSPEATRIPEEVPSQPEEKAVEPPAPDNSKPPVVKFARYKVAIFISIVMVAVAGLSFGVYRIFFNKPVEAPPPKVEYEIPDDIARPRVRVPGVLTMDRFYISLGEEPNRVLVEMEIILHYQDDSIVQIINSELVVVRDLIFRLTRAMKPSIINEMEERRQLQANLLATLNDLPQLHSDPTDPALTYVQISLLKKR